MTDELNDLNTNFDDLNAKYGLDGQLLIQPGAGGFPVLTVNNRFATAQISLYAAHLLSFRPDGEPHDLIFVSQAAQYKPGKAIRGGTPICWPWFGPDPAGLGRPNHGFARDRRWQIASTGTQPDGTTVVVLFLEPSPATEVLWPDAFRLEARFVVGSTLTISLTTHNRSDRPFTMTQALHTYFQIGDITQTSVQGLAGKTYIDKVDGNLSKDQIGEVAIAGEVDRIYQDPPSELVIHDGALARQIRITSTGNHSAVVWNPWAAGAAKMGDLEHEDYRRFVCVETTNAATDQVILAPGEAFALSTIYAIERD